MKLYELIETVAWRDVWAPLVRYYPGHGDRENEFRTVFGRLLETEPSRSDVSLFLERTRDEITMDSRVQVFPKQDWVELATWWTDICPRSVLLGMAVDEKTLQEFPAGEIVAHCIYEMTDWNGTVDDGHPERTKPASSLVDMKNSGRYDLMWARLEPWENEVRG